MNCKNCGAPINSGDIFCGGCGKKLTAQETVNSVSATDEVVITPEEITVIPPANTYDQIPTNSMPQKSMFQKFQSMMIKFKKIRAILAAIALIIMGVLYFTGDSAYIKSVKEMHFYSRAFGNNTLEGIAVGMARYVTHDMSINKKDFKWSEKNEEKNHIVYAKCEGPLGPVTIRIATKQSGDYISSNTDWITITYNGRTVTLTNL